MYNEIDIKIEYCEFNARKLGANPTLSRNCKSGVMTKTPLGNREGGQSDDA